MSPDRRVSDNARVREALDVIQSDYRTLHARNQENLASLRRTVVWLVTFVLIVLFGLGGAVFYFNGQNQALRRQDQARAIEAKKLAVAIQNSRLEAVRTACEEGNARHDATIKALDTRIRELSRIAVTPEQRARIQASRASTIALINALAPRLDCAARVRALSHIPVP